MADMNDMDLVRDYASRNSEAAFSELTQRHINFIYSVAHRFTNNAQDAQDLTQAVFIVLSKKAGQLCNRTILTPWLYETTRLVALAFLRNKARRAIREREASMQNSINSSNSESVWQQLMPHLDDAMGRLNEKDRALVVLRFFDNRSLAETAEFLGIQEWAARKRAQRVIKKLRLYFMKRGIVVAASTMTSAIEVSAVQAAPVGLAKAVTAVALAKGATASTSTLALVKGTLKIMAWSKTKTAVVAGVALLLGVGTTLVTLNEVQAHRTHPNIEGAWEGALSTAQQSVRLVFKVARQNGTYTATFDSVDQGIKDLPVNMVNIDGHTVTFAITGLKAKFVASLDMASRQMSGSWQQATLHLPLTLKYTTNPDTIAEPLAEAEYAPRTGSEIQGFWQGILGVGRMPLQLNLKIAESTDGTIRAEMQSVSQSSQYFPANQAARDGNVLKLNFPGMGISFEGRLDPDSAQITGKLKQGRKQASVIFKRADWQTEQALENSKNYTYASQSDLQGHWQGTLDAKKIKLRLVLNIAQMPDGSFAGTVDSPDQGVNGIPADAVQFAFPNVHIEWDDMRTTYDAKLANGQLSGAWRAGTASFQVTFKRTATNNP